jgi:hypothetical protein
MKVAVLFTGALRTIKKTIRYFKENVLLNSDVHVFACIQNDTEMTDTEWNEWLSNEMELNLKNIEWFNIVHHPHWLQNREFLLSNMVIEEYHKHYLRNSGSMIEYYQLQLAYIKMMNYELLNNFKYDYIIRTRTDTVFAKPIDFHWLNWTNDDVQQRIEIIKKELIDCNLDSSDQNVIRYFMNTVISDKIIPNIHKLTGGYIPNRDNSIQLHNLYNYIKNGSYILTFRVNLLYIVKRDLFYLVPCIGTLYGFLLSKNTDPSFRWNAECQFQAACYNSNLTIFDYSTEYDEKSLYEYDEKRYFDTEFNILNPHMVYCLVRY